MPQVAVWECPRTGKLIKDQDQYVDHLRQLAAVNLSKRRRDIRIANLNEQMKPFYACASFKEIVAWIENNPELLFRRAYYNHCNQAGFSKKWPVEPPCPEKFRISDVEFTYMKWSDFAPNTHRAPPGRRTNWCNQNPALPSGYPGWVGTIVWTVHSDTSKNMCDLRWQDFFIDIGFSTGGGGNSGKSQKGSETYRHDVTIWEECFPNLKSGRRHYRFAIRVLPCHLDWLDENIPEDCFESSGGIISIWGDANAMAFKLAWADDIHNEGIWY